MPPARARVTRDIRPSSGTGYQPDCWTTGCARPGPFASVRELAEHRAADHGDDLVEVLRDFNEPIPPELDADAAPGAARPPKEVPMATTTLVPMTCGKKIPAGRAVGGHRARCLTCRAARNGRAPTTPSGGGRSRGAGRRRRDAAAGGFDAMIATLEAQADTLTARAAQARKAAALLRDLG